MSLRVVLGVEDGQENQTECTGNGEEDREDGAQLVKPAPVGHKLTGMTKPALSQKGQVQEDDGDDATSDEERFQARGANVGNVSVIRVSCRPAKCEGHAYAMVWPSSSSL